MNYLGEILSLAVAFSWTITALSADAASHKIGAQQLNLIRMGLSLILLSVFLVVVTGSPVPVGADAGTWFWLAASGLVGYVFGDFCLFNSYIVFGSKFGQLFMTLAPPIAGITGWIALGEKLSWHSWLAMAVTLLGIAISILAKDNDKSSRRLSFRFRLKFKLPIKGILFGIGAGIGQGVGLVLSKIGLEHYTAALPAGTPDSVLFAMPFAGTFIRAIFGFMGFFIILSCSKQLKSAGKALRNRSGMKYTLLATIFGPFIGVSLSLMAVQYAKAGIASTLMALTPVLIIVPYSLIHKQKIKLQEVFGTLVTITGVALFFLL